MDLREGPLAMAERHAREAEEHVARQRVRVEALQSYGHPRAVELAQLTLETMQNYLGMAQKHLRSERKRHGLEP
ncbi:hypothetical protein [Sabulicella rubraurantiaca]|uniref:hypothetical protein n=1 Tax=Sabulicella rubraurantiaca TaxID=2811429 RepID=UPI001A95F94F|nr:hypothetical protein [Sabulicella rubraurantiaca]